jgi:hypothetical protein
VDASDAPHTKKELNMLIKDVYAYVAEKGVTGGCLIFHPWRVNDAGKTLAHKAGLHTWEWVRAQKNFKEYIYYSPHFHLLAYIGYLKPPESGERFIYRTSTDDSNSIIDFRHNQSDLYRMAGYLLTHTADIEGLRFDSIRWFGSCSKNKFPTDVEEEPEKEESAPKTCFLCGAPLAYLWPWMRDNGYAFHTGELDMKYDDELWNHMRGEPPPVGEEAFVV